MESQIKSIEDLEQLINELSVNPNHLGLANRLKRIKTDILLDMLKMKCNENR